MTWLAFSPPLHQNNLAFFKTKTIWPFQQNNLGRPNVSLVEISVLSFKWLGLGHQITGWQPPLASRLLYSAASLFTSIMIGAHVLFLADSNVNDWVIIITEGDLIKGLPYAQFKTGEDWLPGTSSSSHQLSFLVVCIVISFWRKSAFAYFATKACSQVQKANFLYANSVHGCKVLLSYLVLSLKVLSYIGGILGLGRTEVFYSFLEWV